MPPSHNVLFQPEIHTGQFQIFSNFSPISYMLWHNSWMFRNWVILDLSFQRKACVNIAKCFRVFRMNEFPNKRWKEQTQRRHRQDDQKNLKTKECGKLKLWMLRFSWQLLYIIMMIRFCFFFNTKSSLPS